jgi:DNA-directed RNA polymerase subunit M/transcription elongation factor TFIIS
MAQVRKTDATTVCEKCGAAMVIVRVWQIPEEPEVHMFRCEICEHTAFFRMQNTRV